MLATRLADAVGLPTAQVRAAFYTALLHHVGCVGYAHQSAQLLGDDLRANLAAGRTDLSDLRLDGLRDGARRDGAVPAD